MILLALNPIMLQMRKMNRLSPHRSIRLNPKVYTARVMQEDGWWVGVVEEVPGVVSEGKTKQELMENLLSALEEMLETYREEAKGYFRGHRSQEFVLA